MIINSPYSKYRRNILINKYIELLKSGVSADEILVLVENSKKKKEFLEGVKKLSKEGSIGNLRIFSFFGLCYNTILDNWAIVENSIKNQNTVIIPNLSGLEVSQYIFKDCIKEVDFSMYNSKVNLLHQLLRRYSLINLNNLTDSDVEKRAQILGENFKDEAKAAISKYKTKTIELRAFDYIRQINLFEFIYKKIENPYKYVFLDDGDEIVPALLSYLEYIKPTTKEFFIGYDKEGSSRLGYLGAINVNFEEFLEEKEQKAKEDEKTKNALKILNNVREDKLIELENIDFKTYVKRNEMVDCAISDIKKLIKEGIKPSEIAIITPVCDEYLKMTFEKTNLPFTFISKNEKLSQNKLIGYILDLLKIINRDHLDISPYILKGILIELLHFDEIETIKLIQEYKIAKNLNSQNFAEFIKNKEEFESLAELIEKIKDKKLSEQFYEILSKFVSLDKSIRKDIIKINQLLKQIVDFEEVFSQGVENFDLIVQLENTIISENPLSDDEIEDESILVSTAQKIIDYSYETKYQFWLDCKNENWIKQDIGPLYNAWVMQKIWDKKEYTLEDNINLTKDKTARTIYKLFVLSDNITLYSSLYDTLGIENFSGIDKYFKFENLKEQKETTKIIPRPDQKAVLDYKGGLMSVSATAGSGKTTILLLLIEKILKGEVIKDIEAKNIFVLTFMDSAARNFKERLKSKFPDMAELPNISTIHGLALRIIKENNNYSRLGLDYDFEIVDDIKRNSFLNEILSYYKVPLDKFDLYNRAISAYKNELALYSDYKTSNKLFLNIFEGYQKKLKEENLLDYDDLLLYSLKLLRENKDILEYYQNLAAVIIEDEAQDSSAIQQSLIGLLGAKHKNIVRCGDINQAITGTFTNSDTKGFRDFMKKSQNVVMDRCQRCATGVLDSANTTVRYADINKIDAFSDLIMKPVEGKNTVDKNAQKSFVFEESKDESAFVVNKIKEILKQDRETTIAILLRSNFAIEKWDKLLSQFSIKTYKNSDNLINNPLYRAVVLTLEYIKDPYDKKTIQNLAQELYDIGYYDSKTLDFIQSLKTPLFLSKGYDEAIFWDMNYFLYKNYHSIYDLVWEISSFYFSKHPQNVNIPLLCAIAQKIENTYKTFEDTTLKLREIQNKFNFSNIKFFDTKNNSEKSSKVQIMTLHKSKGDEFDYVFIPELTEDNLCLDIGNLKLKENSKFIQNIKYKPKTELEMKKEIIEENYRLIYVGITRAKKKLYLTSAKKYKIFSRTKDTKISSIFKALGGEDE